MSLLRAGALGALGLLLAVLTTGPSQAAEIDRYLPDDTEAVVTFNVRQALDSPLIKKNGLEAAKEALKSLDEVNSILIDLGFDPFKDLDRMVIASPGGNDKDKGLIIVHGRFDLDKFKAKGEEAAKDHPDELKIHKIADGQGGQLTVYEVNVAEVPTPLFVSLASKNTVLVSPGKDYVVEALKRKDKPTLKNKDLQGLLEKMDPKQSWSMAVVRSAWDKAELPDAIKSGLDDLEAVGGGITIGDDINLELAGSAKNAQAAKEISRTVNDYLTKGLGILALIAGQEKKFAPAVDIVKTIRCNARDKTVILKAQLSAEVLEKLFSGDN